MKKRGPIIGISGLALIIGSILIMISVFPTDVTSNDFYIPTMFEGMFSQISENIQIMPNEFGYFSYSTKSSDVPMLWGIQILDYQDGDKLSVSISNIYGDNYGMFSQEGPVIFETLEIKQSDTLNFEIKNQGSRIVNVVLMISEDPDNSNALSDPNSPFMNKFFPLVISSVFLILGIIMLLIGLIMSLLDLKKNNKQNF